MTSALSLLPVSHSDPESTSSDPLRRCHPGANVEPCDNVSMKERYDRFLDIGHGTGAERLFLARQRQGAGARDAARHCRRHPGRESR